jgi:hypothetical protein
MAMTCAGAVLFSGCTKDLKDDIEDLKKKVATLESASASLETSLDAGALVKSVTELPRGSGTGMDPIEIIYGTPGDPADFGTCYQWGTNSTTWDAGHTYSADRLDMTAANQCPAGYVVPTRAQLETLVDAANV